MKRDSIEDQSEAVREIAVNIADLVQAGNDVVVTHGNGPQVGFELRRSEVASEVTGMDVTPLVNCVAGTQGGIGYLIQRSINK